MNARQEAAAGSARILVVDDDRTQADMLGGVLDLEGFEVACCYAPEGALEQVGVAPPDIVVSDFRMPGMTGLDLYERIKAADPSVIFIIITAFGTLETAVAAMRAGVHDFITKPVNTDELLERIKKALRMRSLERENRRLRLTVDSLQQRMDIVGQSPQMNAVLQTVEQVSQSQATVLLAGESGTGKELVARALHVGSPRAEGPYVRVNCAAIPDNLLEDELFGHARGAFTGAESDRKGKFELAHDGSLFLDEVGDLPLHLQPKLLRAIQEREVEPIGSNRVVQIDVRLIAATHRDLAGMVSKGEFREDLYYRLNVIPIELPPLRERTGDVKVLAEFFLARYCDLNARKLSGFTAAAMEKMETYSWPGNVRELENCVERAVVLARGDQVDLEDLLLSPPKREDSIDAVVDLLFDTSLSLEDLERRVLATALQRCGGNLSKTARTLGLTRRAMQYRTGKMKDEDGDPPREETP